MDGDSPFAPIHCPSAPISQYDHEEFAGKGIVSRLQEVHSFIRES
jgi:hypothetical protein